MGLNVVLKRTTSTLVLLAGLTLGANTYANPLGQELKTLMNKNDAAQENVSTEDSLYLKNANSVMQTYTLFDDNFSVFDVNNYHLIHKNNFDDPENTKQRILFTGIQTYLNLVLQNKMVTISQTNVQLVEEIETFIETEFKDNRLSQSDLNQARASLSQARETLSAYSNLLQEAESQYAHLFNHVPNKDHLQEPFTPSEIIPETLEEALNLALQNQNTKAEKSQTADQPLLQNAALVDLRYKELRTKEQVRIAFNNVESAELRYHTLQESENIAEDAFNLRHDMMQSGQETIINVLDTAMDLLDVRLALTSSEFNHRLQLYQLLLATGQLRQNSISDLMRDDAVKPALPVVDTTSLNTAPSVSTAHLDTQGYDDLAAFEAAHGAPYSDELSPEPSGELSELQEVAKDQAGYYLVLGSFKDTTYAKNFIVMAGMDNAFTRPVNLNGTTYQRVLVGPMNKDSATYSKLIARDLGIHNSWLLHEN